MPDGGTLTLAARDSCDNRVCLTVSDTGSGMDEQTLAHAADPFFSTKGLDGSGLGLSMVKGFAEQSGGTLRIVSQLGQGTAVDLNLPPALDRPIQIQVPACGTPARGRVLLVDDTTAVLMTTGAFLTHAGFQVTLAHDGTEALALLAGGARFDALVTDFAMPRMNGAELVVNAQMLQPDLPAVIISGFADAAGLETRPVGVPVLPKPFSGTALVAAIERVLALVAV